MQGKNAKKFIIAICASAAIAVTGLTGCRTGGNQRSAGTKKDDATVTKNVEKRLKDQQIYKYENVKVNTFNGVVQLTGFANTPDQKNLAAQLAATTPGVREVMNNIALTPTPPTPTGYPHGEFYYGGAGPVSTNKP